MADEPEKTNYIETLKKSHGSNRDTGGLGAIRLGQFVVGGVDEINGDDGRETPEFVITQHELKQLARYWMEERFEHDVDWFLYQQTGSSEWRRSIYIGRRLDRIHNLLGQEEMDRIWLETETRVRKECSFSDEDWRVFRQGSVEEQDLWREKNLPEFWKK